MKDTTGDNSKRNLFSQNDSDAQFIEQEPLSDEDDDDDDDEEYWTSQSAILTYNPQSTLKEQKSQYFFPNQVNFSINSIQNFLKVLFIYPTGFWGFGV